MKYSFVFIKKLVFGFLTVLDIFLSASETNDPEVAPKKNSSLAWGDTHDDGWID